MNKKPSRSEFSLKIYYALKPLIPRSTQVMLRRRRIRRRLSRFHNVWPIDEGAAERPAMPFRWPNDSQFAVVLTHDVDTSIGLERSARLAEFERTLGVSSTFFFVPEKYHIAAGFLDHLRAEGFEVGVHGLNHDGKLYRSHRIFQARSEKINHYLQEWNAVGFRSPAMHHNLDWMHDLDIEYDASTFDTDPFEPQSDSIRTIYPKWIANGSYEHGYIELPYTLPQDFTLFVLMQQSVDLWLRKVDWIAQHGGMVVVLTHPDYMHFPGSPKRRFEYSVERYAELLEYLERRYHGSYWRAHARDVATYWKSLVLTQDIRGQEG